jgi:hypothetical protein
MMGTVSHIILWPGSRLDPRAVSLDQSGVTTAPIDGVSAILIRG